MWSQIGRESSLSKRVDRSGIGGGGWSHGGPLECDGGASKSRGCADQDFLRSGMSMPKGLDVNLRVPLGKSTPGCPKLQWANSKASSIRFLESLGASHIRAAGFEAERRAGYVRKCQDRRRERTTKGLVVHP